MEGGRRYLVVLVLLQLSQGLVAQNEVQVMPKYVLVNPGEEVNLMCKLNGVLDLCLFYVAGFGLNMKPGREKDGVSYQGAGLEKGECGVTIRNVQEKHNGNMSCSLALEGNDPTGKLGFMYVVVAEKPKRPELEVSVGTENRRDNTYRERDTLTATCTVRDARPVANISWFLNDEQILEGLRMPVEFCTPQNRELCTIQQNLTRTLQANDDKKTLRCVANHFSLKAQPLFTEYKINVNYPPKPSVKPIEHFGMVEGAEGRIPLTIYANPKPHISWVVGGDTIYEGTRNGRYEVEKTNQKGPGEFMTVLIIDSLTKEDTDKEYKVIAHNDLGETSYYVSISTSPGPAVLEMGAGLIIVIVVAVLLSLVILAGIFYARAKGKFCFAVGSADKRVAAASEGTENPAVNHHASSEYITNSPELKKEKPKEDTPV